MSDLLSLAERVEGLSEPCRSMDHEIATSLPRGDWWQDCYGHPGYEARPFTASIDAAMTLIPDGYCMPSEIVYEAMKALGKAFSLHMSHWPLITPYPEYLARYVAAAALRAKARSAEGGE